MKEQEIVVDEYESKISNISHPNQRATLAMLLADHFSIVAAVPDGEDSSGRQKCRLMTPTECTERACAIADELYNAFDQRGWLLTLPNHEEVLRRRQELKDARREKK